MRISTRRQHPGARSHSAAPWVLLALVALLAWPLAPRAQPRPADRLPEALNPGSAVPPVQHQSAFARYRRGVETPVGSWREANDTVTRIGGWRVYTREAHAPEAPASAPASGQGAHEPHGHHGVRPPAGARP